MKLYEILPSEIQESDVIETSQEDVVGIDLGTTNSLVAISQCRKVTIIKDEKTGEAFTPSVVAYLDKQVIVGKEAYKYKDKYIASIKRLMGKSKSDINFLYEYKISNKSGAIRVVIDGKEYTPTEISAEILKILKKRAEIYLNKSVNKAVITVPAYFDDAARQATKDAAKLAGLDVFRLINEPTSAAIAYGLESKPEGIYAVFDFGGGTFDVSILKMQKGIFQVLATMGDTRLGGDDFDYAILDYLKGKSQVSITDVMGAKQNVRKIREFLTTNNIWEGEFCGVKISLTINEFEQIVRPFIEKSISIFRKCIKDAEIEFTSLNEIVLAGGITRTPIIKKAVTEAAGKLPLDTLNPDEIVVQGAAIQAEGLITEDADLLIDVTPLSLGIELGGNIVEHIIPRNTIIPTIRKQIFTTQQEGQTSIKIHVLQGESNEVNKCRSLALFELKNLPILPAGMHRIEVSFQLDANGILTVSARDLRTGVNQKVLVKPSYGLSEEETVSLLKKQIN